MYRLLAQLLAISFVPGPTFWLPKRLFRPTNNSSTTEAKLSVATTFAMGLGSIEFWAEDSLISSVLRRQYVRRLIQPPKVSPPPALYILEARRILSIGLFIV